MKAIDGIKLFFIIIFSFIIGGIVSISLLKFTPIISEILGTSNNTIITKNSTKVYEKSSLAASIEKIYDATVVVQTYQQDQLMGSGSGFVYKVDNKYGYILTNEHVVSDSKEIKVLFTSSEEVEATYLGGDQYLDLAVLRVNKKYVKQIASIGSSEKINLPAIKSKLSQQSLSNRSNGGKHFFQFSKNNSIESKQECRKFLEM